MKLPEVTEALRLKFAGLTKRADGDACWEWQGGRQKRRNGALSYGVFCVGKQRILAHRMAVVLDGRELGADEVVRHRCDNVACVRADHLITGTQTDNLHDMWSRGRGVPHAFPTGESHPSAKMTRERVLELRKEREETGLSFAKLGAKYGINTQTAFSICSGKTWRGAA